MEKLVDNYDDIVCRDSKKVMYQDFIQQKRFTHTVDCGVWNKDEGQPKSVKKR